MARVRRRGRARFRRAAAASAVTPGGGLDQSLRRSQSVSAPV